MKRHWYLHFRLCICTLADCTTVHESTTVHTVTKIVVIGDVRHDAVEQSSVENDFISFLLLTVTIIKCQVCQLPMLGSVWSFHWWKMSGQMTNWTFHNQF